MSAPRAAGCGRWCWVQTVIILVGLAVMAVWTLKEPLTPSSEDCTAQGRDEECWRER